MFPGVLAVCSVMKYNDFIMRPERNMAEGSSREYRYWGNEQDMLTAEERNGFNEALRRNGVDFEISFEEKDGQEILHALRTDFGGCEDQDGALCTVLRSCFRQYGITAEVCLGTYDYILTK